MIIEITFRIIELNLMKGYICKQDQQYYYKLDDKFCPVGAVLWHYNLYHPKYEGQGLSLLPIQHKFSAKEMLMLDDAQKIHDQQPIHFRHGLLLQMHKHYIMGTSKYI